MKTPIDSNCDQEYKDFIRNFFCRREFPIQDYSSSNAQLPHGENLFGQKIIYDTEFAISGTLFIEVANRCDPSMTFIPSGIYASHAVLYLIGDYERYFWFATNALQMIHRSGKYPMITVRQNTLQGFNLPIKDVRKNLWMIEEYLFKESDIPENKCQQKSGKE